MARLVDDQEWGTITGGPYVSNEKKGGLVEFLMPFGNIAPF